jgi:hypothetical protein
LQVLGLNPLSDRSSEWTSNTPYNFVVVAEGELDYPVTKVSWEPLRSGKEAANLLATTGDYLRLWELTDDPLPAKSRHKGLKMKALYQSVVLVFEVCLTVSRRMKSQHR